MAQLKMSSFLQLSEKILDDSSMKRIVIGKYSLESLVMLEILEKSGDDQPKR
jgi:hypothetical protein